MTWSSQSDELCVFSGMLPKMERLDGFTNDNGRVPFACLNVIIAARTNDAAAGLFVVSDMVIQKSMHR